MSYYLILATTTVYSVAFCIFELNSRAQCKNVILIIRTVLPYSLNPRCASPAGSGKGEARESRSRKSNRGGLEIVKTSSAQVLDTHDEPQKEDCAYPKAKTHVSVM